MTDIVKMLDDYARSVGAIWDWTNDERAAIVAEFEKLKKDRDDWKEGFMAHARNVTSYCLLANERAETIEQQDARIAEFQRLYRGQVANDGTYPDHLFDGEAK